MSNYGEILKRRMKILYDRAVDGTVERDTIRKQMIELKANYQIWQRSLLASLFLLCILIVIIVPILKEN